MALCVTTPCHYPIESYKPLCCSYFRDEKTKVLSTEGCMVSHDACPGTVVGTEGLPSNQQDEEGTLINLGPIVCAWCCTASLCCNPSGSLLCISLEAVQETAGLGAN